MAIVLNIQNLLDPKDEFRDQKFLLIIAGIKNQKPVPFFFQTGFSPIIKNHDGFVNQE